MTKKGFPAGIVRWSALALILGSAACADESVMAPEAANDMLIFSADAKGGQGNGNLTDECNVLESGTCVAYGEETRFRHWRYYPAEGVVRECSINALELDRIPARYSRSGIHQSVNETLAVVMVREVPSQNGSMPNPDGPKSLTVEDPWKVTQVGLARWSASFWWTRAADGGYGQATTWTTNVSGIVADWPAADGGDVAAESPWALLNDVFGTPEIRLEEGAGADLDKVNLGVGNAFIPALKGYLGSEATAGPLQGIDCRVEAWPSAGWAPVNTISVTPVAPAGHYHLLDR